MRKIKVVFFAEILVPDFDGASRTMFQLLDRIDAGRFDFLFVCGSGADRINQFECIKLPTLPIPLNPKYKLAIPSFSTEELLRKLDGFAPDVIHIATPSLLGHFGLKYARSRHIPVISIYHTHFISYISYYFKYFPFLIRPVRNYLRKTQNEFYGYCQKIYIPSVTLARELIESGMPKENIKIWQRGIDTTLFSPNKKNEVYIRQLTGNDRPVILFASRLVWEKNLETLIAIYAKLKEKGIQYNWVVAGDGSARKECERRMPDAIFLGQLDHGSLSVLYASASLFIFPSISETFGNVVLEAMASGLVPVIADGGGSKDMITNGFNGYKCKADDPDAFVEKIAVILEDEALRLTLRKNALEYIKAFDWEELAQIYFDDLVELASLIIENERA
ncbi:glycosyltransferase family 4 protein [Dyadobacter arcticus]|uniref:Glycosyltransferase involved in cell wall biosynthesis n=1 Tax=Dyadobacter arcticus TaxID=1078754 RepID=A0ABX0UQW1_9BACT|nr:glycosyltransferase family 1 protein [Dyadobacter arcticus]NIJ54509.1 glycosyltransferase involved in cell wall biosynthesis [Dyadobacter arcticus]